MSRKLIVLALGVVAAGGSPAQADTVWSQPGGSGGAGTGHISDDSYSQRVADQFTSSGGSYALTSVSWWGVAYPSLEAFAGIDSFVIGIFESDVSGTKPKETPIAGLSASISTNANDPSHVTATEDGGGWWRYAADLTGWVLPPGDYWFSVMAETSTPNGSYKWIWQMEQVSGSDGGAYRTGASAWTAFGAHDMAWQLEGSIQNIPLPAPILLGALGLAGVVPVRRRLMPRA